MTRSFIFFTLSLVIASCNQPVGKDQQPPAPAQPATESTAAPTPSLPSVPMDLVEKIWNEGTQVDYIFYNYPFTMSLTEKGSIQYAVRHIAEGGAPMKPACKTEGRVTYQVDGNIVLEGDFYFSPGCTYFVFYEKQEKKYANYMTDDGIKYFNQQIQQALKMREQVQQQ